MISSRAESGVFSGDAQVKLSEVRKRLQKMLHSLRWSGGSKNGVPVSSEQQVFEVWIHENEKAAGSQRTPFEISLDEINRAQIVIVLYNGEAGWAIEERQVGICHAEYQEAVSRRSNIVHVVKLAPTVDSKKKADKAFQTAMENAGQFYATVTNEEELQASVLELLQKACADLVRRGASGGRSRDRGLALDWTRLDMVRRRDAMCQSLAEALEIKGLESPADGPRIVELAGQSLAVQLHAVPGAMGVAAAREMVGQPFLRDHLWVDDLTKRAPGIVHMVACYKGVTENQASKIIGTPDTITVASDFGVYAADHIQQIQLIFLAQCADSVAVDVSVRRVDEWLRQTKEINRVVQRAKGRLNILRAIRDNLQGKESSRTP
jgi:hypothetical protein